MDLGLQDRVAIVAAASKGLGRAVAEQLASEGAEIAICARTAADLEAAAVRIRAAGGREVFWEALDVSDAPSISGFVDSVEKRFGRVDICVTNTGGPPSKLIHGHLRGRLAHLDRPVADEYSPFRKGSSATHAEAKLGPISGNYFLFREATRRRTAALELFARGRDRSLRTLANEFGQYGITVNNLCPGYTRTDRLDDLAQMMGERSGATTEDIFGGWKKLIPAGRLGRPEEFAAAAAFLASERASYINGVSLTVDGGTTRSLF